MWWRYLQRMMEKEQPGGMVLVSVLQHHDVK